MVEVDDSNDIIHGISGKLPNRENVEKSKENLLAGNDTISPTSRSDTEGARKSQTKHDYLINEEMWIQPAFRIPFINDEIQPQLPINENQTVFVFPGVEGFAASLQLLAKNLPFQVLCFQYHLIETDNFVQTLCEFFSKFILENLAPEQKFYLIGHSLGSAITLEVAQMLEKQGRKGRIWLIDSTPKTVKMVARDKFDEHSTNDEHAQILCMKLVGTFLPQIPKDELAKLVEQATDWDTKKKSVFMLISRVTKNENIVRRLFDGMITIPKALLMYEISEFRLNSPCALIRTAKNLFDMPLDEAYGLTKHFQNPIEVHKIDGVDHYSILSHANTAEIIIQSVLSKD